ncbi:DUF4861 family protein [Algibacter mikhailovii]|uniref:DUF4861 family protein n=1 Tax=Algibacter mikhailovii TaxID=425498 RepID=UPI002494D7A9|nr:DUF4861 family protein [Algibacter mikhailovii]
MKILNIIVVVLTITFLSSCAQKKQEKFLLVKNTLNMDRTFETLELSKDFLKVTDLSIVGILDKETNELQITQLIDTDEDGIMDELLFQPNLGPNSEKKYQIIEISAEERPKPEIYCYSRFVPERTDDYAWENDRVAFRTYGPNAQYRFENKLEEGTLSSGIDAWLKRVDYLIIDKWYKEYTEKTGTYHEDTGEGLDNFHVGKSRGVGGITYKNDTTYHVSKNFITWRTITTGPIRTSFVLDYAEWDAGGKLIKDSKLISLDRGNNLSKFEITLEGGVDKISAGLTLHDKKGEVSGSNTNNWVSYWEDLDDSEIGTGIVTTSDYFDSYERYDSEVKDWSNAFLNLKVKDNKVVYYSGFGWMKSGQFNDNAQWKTYLNHFSERINNPLEMVLK